MRPYLAVYLRYTISINIARVLLVKDNNDLDLLCSAYPKQILYLYCIVLSWAGPFCLVSWLPCPVFCLCQIVKGMTQ